MFKPKLASLFRRGKPTSSKLKYHALDYEGGYTFTTSVAYGQLNQLLDLAAHNPKKIERILPVADRWLEVIGALDKEAEMPQSPIGFRVQPREETDDSDESDSEV